VSTTPAARRARISKIEINKRLDYAPS